MNKQTFMTLLHARLVGLPRHDLEDRLNFYSEMIDDRIEEGLSEEEAVRDIENVDEIASSIFKNADTPSTPTFKDKRKKKLSKKEITLLAVCSPLWISLVIAAGAVAISLAVAATAIIISLYAVLWSVVISLWATSVSLAVCAPASIILSIFHLFYENPLNAGFLLSGALLCAGLAIIMMIGTIYLTRGSARLTKKSFLSIIGIFKKRRHNNE